jgi:hypothetical protein
LQHIQQRKTQGASVWRVFWGASDAGSVPTIRTEVG